MRLCFLALGVGVAAMSSANLLTNGSFEDATFDPGPFQQLNAGDMRLTGWSIVSGSIDYIGTYWPASDGVRSLDMTGITAGAIAQDIATNPGDLYQITFDMSGNPVSGPDLKTMTISAGDSTETFSYDIAANGNSRTDMQWQGRSMTFTATSATTTVLIASTTVGQYGPAVDNFSVEAVPEPASLLALGAGVAALMRRRRK